MSKQATYEQFHGWIKKAEADAATNPSRYRRKVALFATLGYAYVFTLLALVVASLLGLAAVLYFRDGASGSFGIVKLGIIFALFAWALVSALWVTFDAPEGTPVTAAKYPKLVSEINDLQQRLDTIPIHQTIIVPEFNAFVAQTPRLGVLGWQRNTLALGLDLMLALKPEEMRAVIAHELGHLSGNHSKFAGWIYRIRKTWSNLFRNFQENGGWGAGLVNRFFFWYVPRFDAYSFALRRQNEYEADAASAELTSRETAGTALLKISVLSEYFDRQYWREFHAAASHDPEPRRMAYAAMAHDLPSLSLRSDAVARYRDIALAVETGFEDTHPSLADRLKGLGLDAAKLDTVAFNSGSSAAAEWLGAELAPLISEYDRAWWEHNGDGWIERHRKVQAETAEMQDLRGRPIDGLEQMQLWRLGVLTSRYIGEGEALPMFRAYQTRYPDDVDAAIVIGRFLANTDDPKCLNEWRQVPREHAGFVNANHAAADFLEAKGHAAEAAYFRTQATERENELESAEAEHGGVSAEDKYRSPDLSPGNLNYLLSGLEKLGSVGAAWLAEKAVRHEHGMPIYVLAVRAKMIHLSRITTLDADDAAFNAVVEQFPDAHSKHDPFRLFVTQAGWMSTGRLAKLVKKHGQRIL